MIKELSSNWTIIPQTEVAEHAGLRFGAKGAHTSRTVMLRELTELMAKLPEERNRAAFSNAIITDNILGKQTYSTRQLTSQRLTELYGLDDKIPIFHVVQRLWEMDERSRPLLALLCALGRDPLLRSAASYVMPLRYEEAFEKDKLMSSIQEGSGSRLNDNILDKVARNTGSSFTQSGHLSGRYKKIRKKVNATPYTMAFALWLGYQFGKTGEELLSTPWVGILDIDGQNAVDLVLKAKQLRLVRANIGGGIIEINPSILETDWR